VIRRSLGIDDFSQPKTDLCKLITAEERVMKGILQTELKRVFLLRDWNGGRLPRDYLPLAIASNKDAGVEEF